MRLPIARGMDRLFVWGMDTARCIRVVQHEHRAIPSQPLRSRVKRHMRSSRVTPVTCVASTRCSTTSTPRGFLPSSFPAHTGRVRGPQRGRGGNGTREHQTALKHRIRIIRSESLRLCDRILPCDGHKHSATRSSPMSKKQAMRRRRKKNRLGTGQLRASRLKRLWIGERLEMRAAPGSMLSEIFALTGNPLNLAHAASQIATIDPVSAAGHEVHRATSTQHEVPLTRHADHAQHATGAVGACGPTCAGRGTAGPRPACRHERTNATPYAKQKWQHQTGCYFAESVVHRVEPRSSPAGLTTICGNC